MQLAFYVKHSPFTGRSFIRFIYIEIIVYIRIFQYF